MATLRQVFGDIADAIRGKGVSGTFKPIEMAQKIGEISGGGGDGYGYLTFTAQQTSTLKLGRQGTSIEYQKLLKSNDAVNWERWENPDTNTISLSSGQSVYIKAADDASNRTASYSSYNKLVMSGNIQVTGDIRSIVNPRIPDNYSYWIKGLFYGCSSLTKAPELPSTVMIDGCYSSMFLNCTSLTQAPELPATTLASNCYEQLFYGCRGLTQAPRLPATTLTSYCYSYMFYGCSSLVQAPELPATTVSASCYEQMFYNCRSLKRIKMNASSGGWGQNMFNGCTSLELVDMTGSIGVPTLSSTNNFALTNDTYKIVVPDSLYDTWIAATNWSSAAIQPHIMKQSDWNAEHPDDQL